MPACAARFVDGRLEMTPVPGPQTYAEGHEYVAIDRERPSARPISEGFGTCCELSSRQEVALPPKRRRGRHPDASPDDGSGSDPAPPLRSRAKAPIGFSETWFCGSANRWV